MPRTQGEKKRETVYDEEAEEGQTPQIRAYGVMGEWKEGIRGINLSAALEARMENLEPSIKQALLLLTP